MTNETKPLMPSLHEMLSAIMLEQRAIKSSLADLHLLLAKRGASALAATTPPTHPSHSFTLEQIALEMQQRLDSYWTQLAMPMQFFHLGRNFTRKLGYLGKRAIDAAALMPNIHLFPSGSGGQLCIPKSEWERLSDPRRQYWIGISARELRAHRKNEADEYAKVHQKMMNEGIEQERAEKRAEYVGKVHAKGPKEPGLGEQSVPAALAPSASRPQASPAAFTIGALEHHEPASPGLREQDLTEQNFPDTSENEGTSA